MSRGMVDDSDYFKMSDISLKIGNKICIKTTQRLLESSLLLVNNSANLDHALGLYTFAVEEFGKAVLLKEQIDNDSTIKKIPKEVFGIATKGSGHNIKFEKAKEILPDECIILGIGEILNMPSGKDMEHSLGRKIKEKVTISAYTTGTFLTDVMISFPVRMRCFYVDWDENSEYWHKWKANLQTDRDTLKKAISKFKEIIPNYDFTSV